MTQSVACPHCQRQLSIKDELAGNRLACPHCKGVFVAPPSKAMPLVNPEVIDSEPEQPLGLEFLSARLATKPSTRLAQKKEEVPSPRAWIVAITLSTLCAVFLANMLTLFVVKALVRSEVIDFMEMLKNK
jgi:hypothetical protein